MRNRYLLSAVVASSVVLAGCFDGSSSSSVDPVTTQVRVLHAVSDAPDVNVNVNGDVAVPGAGFRQAGILNPAVGTYSVSVDAILPDESTVQVIDAPSLSFEEGINYEIIASGSVGGESVSPIVLEDDGQRDDPDSIRLRVVHLSPEAQSVATEGVEVYLDPNANIGQDDPAFSFSFGDDVGPLETPAGDYRIRVTAAGNDAVVYDSGDLPLAAGADLLIGAIDNTVFGDSPVSMLVVDGAETSELLDVDTQVGLRAVHSAADIGAGPDTTETTNTAVDLYVNKAPDGDPLNTGIFQFGDVFPAGAGVDQSQRYASLDSGALDIFVTADGDLTPAITAELDLEAGAQRTVVAAGNASVEGGSPTAFSFADDNRRIATAAKVRLIHGAAAAGTVDVYLIPAAVEGTTEIGNAAGSPVEGGFEYGAESGYLQVADGRYVAFITEAGNPANVLYESPELTLSSGGIYTVVARLALPGEDQTAGVTLLDDSPLVIE